MKSMIAIVAVLLWLFFPVRWMERFWRRRLAIREADRYAQTLFK